MLASLAAWHARLGSISVETDHEQKAELFYWITITFSQTLGTALGDWAADSGLGHSGADVLFAVGLAVLTALYFTTTSAESSCSGPPSS